MEKLTKAERPKRGGGFPFRTDKPVYRYGLLFIGSSGDDWHAFDHSGKQVSFARTIKQLKHQIDGREWPTSEWPEGGKTTS